MQEQKQCKEEGSQLSNQPSREKVEQTRDSGAIFPAGLPITEIGDEDYRSVYRPCEALEDDTKESIIDDKPDE
jgi:hypothetical protein